MTDFNFKVIKPKEIEDQSTIEFKKGLINISKCESIVKNGIDKKYLIY